MLIELMHQGPWHGAWKRAINLYQNPIEAVLQKWERTTSYIPFFHLAILKEMIKGIIIRRKS